MQADYPTADKISKEIRTSSRITSWRDHPFDIFVTTISNTDDPNFESRLNDWVEHDKNEALPLIVRAQYFYDKGWFKRGAKFASKTRADHMLEFEQYMQKALADCETAIKLNASNPYIYHLRTKIVRIFPSKFKTAFDEAISKYPSYFPIYEWAIGTLTPKWGGSVSSMNAFVDKFAGHAPEGSPLKLLYLSLYRSLLGAVSTACLSYPAGDSRAACNASNMDKVVTSELKRHVESALQLYDHVDQYEFSLAVEDIVSQMLGDKTAAVYTGPLLQSIASNMHSDTQLDDTKSTGNKNYIVDKLVALSWSQQGFYDNALTKYKQALNNLANTKFPSEEDKDLALSSIYEAIAQTYERKRQYADMIVYKDAATALGGRNEHDHWTCFAYYQLKQYDDAERTCSDALKYNPRNISARYWRGATYREMGRTDDALKDLIAVADSEGSFRTSAAIDISMIYFKRDDNRSALEILNKYQYLYDPDLNYRYQIAVAYNNRCYAYMQLGQLQNALHDCTESVKFGSIPDAFRKLEQLNGLLKVEKTHL